MSSIRSRCSSTHCSGTIEATPQTTARTPAASAAKVSVSQPLSSVGPSRLDQLGRGDGVATGVLEAGDGKLPELRGGERDPRRARQVVVHDRDLDRVRDGRVVREQLGPRERVVERRDDHHRGGAGPLGVHAQLDGLARRERAGAGDDGDAAAGRFDGDLDELAALGVRERGELAGAPARDQPADAGADQAVDDRGERLRVDRVAVVGERRDEGGQDSVERAQTWITSRIRASTRSAAASPVRAAASMFPSSAK